MTMVKVNELSGVALDYMVAVSNGACVYFLDDFINGEHRSFNPSTNSGIGGAIIERELIATYPMPGKVGGAWRAEHQGLHLKAGNTPLIAGMRCYVASKLGDTVDIPASIMKAWEGER